MKRGIFLVALFALLAMVNTAVLAQESEKEMQPEVTIVKYSDYECPACKYYFNFEERLKDEFGDQIEIVTKHFPLAMHPHAQIASRAVEAARKQGKYHEMHEMVFEGQEQWARGNNAEATFIGYASSLDLDMEEFKKDINSAEMQRIVMADRREGINLNVNSTPTFFVNGEKLDRNPRSYEAFKNLIKAYIGETE